MSQTVKLITFQSKEVLEQLLKDGIYYADNSRSREQQDYSKDIEALSGHQPVWCFRIPTPYNLEKLYEGNYYLNLWRCEMSLGIDKRLKDFEMIELEVDVNLPLTGETHNSYNHAIVLPYLKLEWLVARYCISERYILDEIGSPNIYYVINQTERHNKKLIPLYETNFHYLTTDEYEEISDSLVPELPLKAYQREGDIELEIVMKYYNREITREEFHKLIGFERKAISTNPLD